MALGYAINCKKAIHTICRIKLKLLLENLKKYIKYTERLYKIFKCFKYTSVLTTYIICR
jgi:hypothetical protein